MRGAKSNEIFPSGYRLIARRPAEEQRSRRVELNEYECSKCELWESATSSLFLPPPELNQGK